MHRMQGGLVKRKPTVCPSVRLSNAHNGRKDLSRFYGRSFSL